MKKQLKRSTYLSGMLSVILLLAMTTGLSDETKQEVRWTAVSKDLGISGSVYPKEAYVKIGQYQKWILELHDSNGDPLYPARISVGGGMPGHGHGLPTQPQVTDYLDNGRYLIEGMKFNMSGDWVLLFGVESSQATGRLKFNLALDY